MYRQYQPCLYNTSNTDNTNLSLHPPELPRWKSYCKPNLNFLSYKIISENWKLIFKNGDLIYREHKLVVFLVNLIFSEWQLWIIVFSYYYFIHKHIWLSFWRLFFLSSKNFHSVFQAVITPSEVTDPSKDPVTGFIVLDIGADGYITYKVSS